MFQDSLLRPRPPWLLCALDVLARYGFATADQLAARFDRPVAEVTQVLVALTGEGHLRSLRLNVSLTETEAPPAFMLTRLGAHFLQAAANGRPINLPALSRSLLMLRHDLHRNTFVLALERLAEKGVLQLLRFETARTKLADVTHVAEHGRVVRVPLVADALAVVDAGNGPTGLLLEQDEGTVSVDRMRLKFRGYDTWWRDGGPVRRHGVGSFRVVTIVPTKTRLNRLQDAALEATDGRGSRLLWFTLQEHVTINDPARLLGRVWQVATHDHTPHPLFANRVQRSAA